MKNFFLRENELMLVSVMETQNVIKRAVKISFSVPDADKQPKSKPITSQLCSICSRVSFKIR